MIYIIIDYKYIQYSYKYIFILCVYYYFHYSFNNIMEHKENVCCSERKL